MIVCKECNIDIYLVQRPSKPRPNSTPYYCWYCERGLNIEEVKFN